MPAKRVLVVVAHPDDVEFAAGGTVAAWTASGVEVAYLLVTRGESGGFDDINRATVSAQREAEQRAAAELVGVDQLTFLDFPDGQVRDDDALRSALAGQIGRFRPGRVVTHAPQRDWTRVFTFHPDHLATGAAALAAVKRTAMRLELWLIGAPAEQVNHAVDITATFDRKLVALRAHASQTGHMSNVEQIQRRRAAGVATVAGFGPGRLAEGFQVIGTGWRGDCSGTYTSTGWPPSPADR